MRILYVVMRYGSEIAGGAEQHCREFAERMVERGHSVEIATTCAQSYVDWANVYPPGRAVERGVVVHRFPTANARDNVRFNELNQRVLLGDGPRPLPMQREWMRMQGPYSPALIAWLEANAPRYDVTVFITYLYWTTWAGLRAVAGRTPTVLHPTAHDEPPLRLSVFDEVFRLPDEMAFLAPEERDLVMRRFPGAPSGHSVGVGVDLPDDRGVDISGFRAQFGLGDDPYVLYVGRVDPSKGALELLDFFCTYKDRNPGSERIVFLGQPLMDFPDRPDVVATGFVDAAVRDAALAGAAALVQPSYFESFSMVLTEAFAHSRPALVQGRCAVLNGHAQRSGAAIPYRGFAEFEAAIEWLFAHPAEGDAMGRAGRAYVARDYDWDTVLDKYEVLLSRTAAVRVP
jgi:glycosyltransferase involved in cell wall biosynthesis